MTQSNAPTSKKFKSGKNVNFLLSSFLILFLHFPILSKARPLLENEAAAYLKELAESSRGYQRRIGNTAIFSRGQLKYSLERSDYLHRWGDRPLMQDSSFKEKGTFKVDGGRYSTIGFLNPLNYKTQSRTLKRFGMDGFAFFPQTTGRKDLYNHCTRKGLEIKVLPEINGQFKLQKGGIPSKTMKAVFDLAEDALKSPQAYRINGKVVLTSYPANKVDSLKAWSYIKNELIKKFGDKFILMPWFALTYFEEPTGKDGRYSLNDIKAMQERLRKWLRGVDGFYHNAPPVNNRRYWPEFDREVIIPIVHSVMMEPEFRNKYLAWGCKVGHMNCQLLGYVIDCFGTDTLRGTLGSAVLAKADVINLVEWDEQNENTCFRPTVLTSFSTLRIIRYFSELAKGEKPSMLPDDDASIPNLILSYRRILQAGELLEFEVTNIPDGTAKCNKYTVTLSLADKNGKIVKKFPGHTLSTEDLKSTLFTVQSETLLNCQTLTPVLDVIGGEKTYRADNGLQPIELRANWNWDYLWAKQPLRDINTHIKATLKVEPAKQDGLIALKANIDSPVDMRSVEVLEGCDVIYSYSDEKYCRETDDKVAIVVAMQANWTSPIKLTGHIKWNNVSGIATTGSRWLSGSDWQYNEQPVNIHPIHVYAELDRDEAEKAEIEVDFIGVVKGKIKVADILKLGAYGFSGPYGFNLVFRRYNSQVEMPVPVNKKHVEFSILSRPASDKSVYYLQIVDKNYHVYRSKPVSLYVPSGKEKTIHVFSVGENEANAVKVDEKLLMPIDYQFSPRHGSVLYTTSNNELLGVLGGYTPLATGVAMGACEYGNAMSRFVRKKPANYFAANIPVYVQEKNANWSLKFNGRSFVSLPLGIVPPFGGYKIEMDVWPENLLGNQTLLSNDNSGGFELTLRKGVPYVSIYCNQFYGQDGAATATSGPTLKAEQWNHIVVNFDQNKLFIEVNGVRGKNISASGYQRYPRAYSIGSHPRKGKFFKGRISKLKIISL